MDFSWRRYVAGLCFSAFSLGEEEGSPEPPRGYAAEHANPLPVGYHNRYTRPGRYPGRLQLRAHPTPTHRALTAPKPTRKVARNCFRKPRFYARHAWSRSKKDSQLPNAICTIILPETRALQTSTKVHPQTFNVYILHLKMLTPRQTTGPRNECS